MCINVKFCAWNVKSAVPILIPRSYTLLPHDPKVRYSDRRNHSNWESTTMLASREMLNQCCLSSFTLSSLCAGNEIYNAKKSPANESHRADRVLGHGLVPSNQSILPIEPPFHNCLPISVPLCPTLCVNLLFFGVMSAN